MSLRVWHTLTGREEDLEPARLRSFACGPTVSALRRARQLAEADAMGERLYERWHRQEPRT